MPDAYTSTGSANFDKTVVELVLKQVQNSLRGGLAYTPKGSVIPATLVPGSNGTFRSFGYSDLASDGAVSIEDGQPDPDVEDLGIDFVEFTGTAKGRTVGITDNARQRSPHNLEGIAAEKVTRDILTSVDNVPRALYKAATPALFGGASNDAVDELASGDKMTASLLKDAVAILRGLDVKPLPNGLYAFVANPFVIRDLQGDDEYVDEMKMADPTSFLTGQVGKYAGAAIIDAGSRGIVLAGAAGDSSDVSLGTLIGADSVFAALGGLRVIPATGPDKADPLDRRSLYSWKGFLGGILNDIQNYRFLNVAVTTSL